VKHRRREILIYTTDPQIETRLGLEPVLILLSIFRADHWDTFLSVIRYRRIDLAIIDLTHKSKKKDFELGKIKELNLTQPIFILSNGTGMKDIGFQSDTLFLFNENVANHGLREALISKLFPLGIDAEFG
jgi:hypothetical protein